ncbi:hypothetical protein JL720_2100 [Aureococcus anophagefferens]|nr:hypothetical protein JL720_2100 [Aureococcus anophagefferens]
MADDETAKKLATDVACAVFSRELNLRKAFSRLDVDKNGAIDRDEFAALLAPLSTACTAAATSAVFDLFDADKSGTISSSEFQDALLEYGGAAPPPPTKKPAAAAKHVEAIKEAAEYVEVDGDTMTDADVMDELSDRLEQEGVPLHTLYRVLAPRDGRMTRDTLRSVLEKMGLGYALASPAEEAAAAKKAPAVRAAEAVVAPAAQEEHVGDALEHANAFNVNQQRACEVLKSGDASDEAVRSLLPILKAKMHAHGDDTGKVGDLFLRLDADRSGSISPREFLELMRSWGVNLTAEQGVHLLEPFDVNLDGSLDFHEFVKWVEMWCPPEDENEYAASWRRGGPTDQRVWARSGDGAGRVGRVDRLMAMIDADHDGAIECYEFIRALSRKDDYDRPIGGGGGGGGLGQGRLNRTAAAADPDAAEAAALDAALKEAPAALEALTPAQLRQVAISDNAMIQQLRAELAERSSHMRDMFARMDADGSGEISVLEFRKGLQKAGFTDHGAVHKKGLDRGAIAVSVEDTVRLFNYDDKDRSGSLSYAEFVKLVQNSVAIDYRPMVVGEDSAVTVAGGYDGDL